MTRMMPGAMAFVQEMKEVFELVLLTNGFEKTQRTKIRACGLDSYVELMITSESVGIAKPDKAIFDVAISTAAEKYGSFNHVFYAGDTWDTDVKGGVNAGIPTFWYNHAGMEMPNDEVSKHPLFMGSCETLSELSGNLLSRV
jgi:5'-nucleotidase